MNETREAHDRLTKAANHIKQAWAHMSCLDLDGLSPHRGFGIVMPICLGLLDQLENAVSRMKNDLDVKESK